MPIKSKIKHFCHELFLLRKNMYTIADNLSKNPKIPDLLKKTDLIMFAEQRHKIPDLVPNISSAIKRGSKYIKFKNFIPIVPI